MHKLAFLAVLAGVFTLSAQAQLKIDNKLPNEMSTYSRQVAVGTNAQRAQVTKVPMPEGRIARLVDAAAADVSAGCAGKTLTIEEATVRDMVGATNTRISGIGLYISLPDSGVTSSGNFYVSPVVLVSLTMRDAGGRELEKLPLSAFDRIPVRDSTFQEFLAVDAKQLDHAVSEYATQKIKEAIKSLAGRHCGAGR